MEPYLLDDDGEAFRVHFDSIPHDVDCYYKIVAELDASHPGWRRIGRSVLEDKDGEPIVVSTVFCLMDQRRRPRDKSQIFQTMIFGGEHDSRCIRYATRGEAEEGHNAIVSAIADEAIAEIEGEFEE